MPRIHLAIDNCFASKRWTEPADWLRVIADLGLGYAEASADNECDPLYTTPEYLADWAEKVHEASAETGARVSQMYSGHGSHATLGLSHPDGRIRDHMLKHWLYPMCDLAGGLGAGLGFFCHAMSYAMLQSPEAYQAALDDLYRRLALVADRAQEAGCPFAGLENMYTPTQVPWTFKGAKALLRAVNALSSAPFHISLDVGHQVGQARFQRPAAKQLGGQLAQDRKMGRASPPWLGSQQAPDLYEQAFQDQGSEEALLRELEGDMDLHPYLFATAEDGDPYRWLGALGRYSPIIHLRQTNGKSSSHLPFTPEHNANGIIDGGRVLRALEASYRQAPEAGMPPPVEDIYLTLEIFSPTVARPSEIMEPLRESVAYWRRYVPRDGLELDELLGGMG